MNLKSKVKLLLILLCLPSCAYQFGGANRTLPNDIKSIAVPQFQNKTMETGIEIYFTNAMRERFHRYPVARIADDKYADALVRGSIMNLTYTPGAKQTSTFDPNPSTTSTPFLPLGAVIAAEYRVGIEALVELVSREDGKVLWSGTFFGETTYASPQVTLPGINTVNPLYNLSARRSNINTLAQQVMEEAFNRMTENF